MRLNVLRGHLRIQFAIGKPKKKTLFRHWGTKYQISAPHVLKLALTHLTLFGSSCIQVCFLSVCLWHSLVLPNIFSWLFSSKELSVCQVAPRTGQFQLLLSFLFHPRPPCLHFLLLIPSELFLLLPMRPTLHNSFSLSTGIDSSSLFLPSTPLRFFFLFLAFAGKQEAKSCPVKSCPTQRVSGNTAE